MIIYKITNTQNNKIYIGKTVQTLKRRKNKHLFELRTGKRPNSHFKRAFDKYGENSFIFEEIDKCSSLEELNNKEIYYIKLFESNNPEIGYNETSGGDGGTGYSKELRTKIGEKVSLKLRGRKLSKDHKIRIGLAHKGKIISEENRKHMSEIMKDKYINGELTYLKPTFYSGRDHGMYGKKHTTEARKKISEARRGKTYEEILGREKAEELIKKKREDSIGEKNPFYKFIDIELVKNKILQGDRVEDIAKDLGVTGTTIIHKFKAKYGIYISEFKRQNNIKNRR